MTKATPSRVIAMLRDTYRKGGVTLTFNNPFELLVATVLAAQCTDVRVNSITPILFESYPTPKALSKASTGSVSKIIHPLGFFNQKSKNIISLAAIISNQHKGKVPNDRVALEALPGVGRKTANIVLSRIFGVPAIAVDTHVKRVASRIFGFSDPDPYKIEKNLMKILPVRVWNDVNLSLIFHGRAICKPREPLCENCVIARYCAFHNK